MSDSIALPHHKLHAFGVACELLVAVRNAHLRDAKLRDESLRAAKSTCLNTAEGAGRVTRADKARAFAIARGEAVEAAAAVEIAALIGDARKEDAEKVARIANRLNRNAHTTHSLKRRRERGCILAGRALPRVLTGRLASRPTTRRKARRCQLRQPSRVSSEPRAAGFPGGGRGLSEAPVVVADFPLTPIGVAPKAPSSAARRRKACRPRRCLRAVCWDGRG